MATMKNTEDALVNAFIRDMQTTNRNAIMRTYQIEITHQAHVMALCCTEEDSIIRMCWNLLKHNCGGLCIFHKSQLEVSLFIKALSISAGIFGDSKPSFERFGILA